jgi:uncharacterized membrane protein YkvI
MRWLKVIISEIFSLFVDDCAFALAIIVWLAATGLMLPQFGVPSAWDAIILFVGLALILVESATRRPRRLSNA